MSSPKPPPFSAWPAPRKAGAEGQGTANPFAYDVSRFQKTDPKLITYEEVARWPVPHKEARRLAIGPDDQLYVCAGNYHQFSEPRRPARIGIGAGGAGLLRRRGRGTEPFTPACATTSKCLTPRAARGPLGIAGPEDLVHRPGGGRKGCFRGRCRETGRAAL